MLGSQSVSKRPHRAEEVTPRRGTAFRAVQAPPPSISNARRNPPGSLRSRSPSWMRGVNPQLPGLVALLVNPPPSINSVTLSLPTIDAGMNTTVTAFETGGTGPYQWVYAGLPGRLRLRERKLPRLRDPRHGHLQRVGHRL